LLLPPLFPILFRQTLDVGSTAKILLLHWQQ
jgi:hypothetical protein